MSGGEDVLELDDFMRRLVVPLRGRVRAEENPRPGIEPILDELGTTQRRVLGDQAELLDRAFANPWSDQDLVAVAREPGFGDFRTASPLSAALALEVARRPWEYDPTQVLDAWILVRGLPFAVAALAESFQVMLTTSSSDGVYAPQLTRSDYEDSSYDQQWDMALNLLKALVAAPEEDYVAAREVAEQYRSASRLARALTSFLFPENTDWCRADIADWRARRDGDSSLAAQLIACAVTTSEQAVDFAAGVTYWRWYDRAPLATLLDRVGGAAVPVLLCWLDGIRPEISRLEHPLDVISRVPADAALQGLIDRADRKYFKETVLKAGRRFPCRALRLLAESEAGDARQAAAVADMLRIHTLTHRDVARDELAALGGPAHLRVAEILADADAVPYADPVDLTVPEPVPALPFWAEPNALPQLLLKNRTLALPPETVGLVVQMLSVSKPDARFTGLSAVEELCDAKSLADFAWALFANWQTADFPPAQKWAFDALRWFGDDDAVLRLAPLIRLWPGESAHHRSVAGLDVLATIGGDVALRQLYAISQKVKFKALKDRAGEKVADVAERLGLTAEQLGDRLVPDLGLEPDGSLALDYGARRFSVGFDEQLQPYVLDEAGNRLKALPKPGTRDDAELAPAAYQRFSALKKDVRTLASEQIARLELAMCTRRRWTAQEFGDYYVSHPLLRHVVRRLVWAVYDGGGGGATAFRLAEDLTFADVDDKTFELPDAAVVGLAHPLDLGAELPSWAELFADYEITQPFLQLGRLVLTLTEEEKQSPNLQRFSGLPMPALKVVGMERRGWRRGETRDGGVEQYIYRPLPDGEALIAGLDPGLHTRHLAETPDQTFTDIWIQRDHRGDRNLPPGHDVPLSQLDAVTASEILRDLTEVTAQ